MYSLRHCGAHYRSPISKQIGPQLEPFARQTISLSSIPCLILVYSEHAFTICIPRPSEGICAPCDHSVAGHWVACRFSAEPWPQRKSCRAKRCSQETSKHLPGSDAAAHHFLAVSTGRPVVPQMRVHYIEKALLSIVLALIVAKSVSASNYSRRLEKEAFRARKGSVSPPDNWRLASSGAMSLWPHFLAVASH